MGGHRTTSVGCAQPTIPAKEGAESVIVFPSNEAVETTINRDMLGSRKNECFVVGSLTTSWDE